MSNTTQVWIALTPTERDLLRHAVAETIALNESELERCLCRSSEELERKRLKKVRGLYDLDQILHMARVE